MTGYRILPIDLSQPLLHLSHTPESIYAIFWWHDIPLGSTVILSEDLPMSSAVLATLAAKVVRPVVQIYLQEFTPASPITLEYLATLSSNLDNIISPSSSIDASVAVVVCTRDRPESLMKCLKSLQALTLAADEIIVVDNAPKNTQTRNIVEKFDGVRYVIEPEPGLSIARNTGIKNCHSDIIAFTDDDIAVHPGWLEQLQSAFSSAKIMAVTGIVLPTDLETESQVLFEFSYGYLNNGYKPQTFDESFMKRHQSRGTPVWDIGAGANMAFKREIFEKVGNFDQRLGAGASGCSEDSEMWYRILMAGWHCRYVPAAVVYHTHRQDTSNLKKQMRLYMQGHAVALLIQFFKFKHFGNLRRLFLTLPKDYARLLKGAIKNNFRGRYGTYWSEILGYSGGGFTYLYLTYWSSSNQNK